MSTQSPARDPVRTLALSIGFLTLAGSVFLARGSPATGYELSLYTNTPLGVWAGLLLALAIAAGVAFVPSGNDVTRSGGVALAGLTVVTVITMPIVRGYRYMGQHDALTHLGWARGITQGSINPFDLFYPGIHTTTTMLASGLEIPVERAMFLVVVLTAIVFFVFVPLTLWTITERRFAVVVGAFAAFLLLPITTISMYLSAHAMSQAVLYSALLCYLFVAYLRTDRERAAFTAVGVAFAVAAIAAVVYHPQFLAHFIVVVFAVCGVQYLARRLARDGPIASQTPMYGQALFLLGLFLVWSSNHGFFSGTIVHFASSIVDFLTGAGGIFGGSAQTQADSLTAVGGSLLELFFRLFTPQFVFSVLAAVLGLAVVLGRCTGRLASIRPESWYFTAAVVALVPLFFAYFFAPGSSMYFRVFGLMMVFVTLLGALAIYAVAVRLTDDSATDSARGKNRRESTRSSVTVPTTVSSHPVFAVVLGVLLVLSLVAIFPSPYTYTESPHVSDTTMSGYETAFATGNDEVDYLGLRDGPNRFDDAVNANEDRSWRHFDVPADVLRSDVAGEYGEDRYLVLTEMDVEREEIAYRGLRYSAGDFEGVEGQPNVDRIQSNGEFNRYYVHDPGPAV
ncbi:hypothetical protein [Natrarchaeobaculum aegyptiacum]|uniref:Glycosyltransferase RgtA/B/C/D-like domain-containing protein n=1 Tax=Natrarchaeobaculum aegyptiacum TaxID=745377 RepID=A0A2Z2HPH2_9EURY|nr:hypothetical protein [Natrarchaeobaculum aegyptiacum]ARS88936.1 hypothetical protein B1756_03655 [Natrarchaeobaculum aegyptiacum]